MSFIKDLTPICSSDPTVLSVGWLDRSEPFHKGTADPRFCSALLEHIKYSAVQTMGRHLCNICNNHGHEVRIAVGGSKFINLGSCEIRVFGIGGVVYAAPNLIYHYVTKCDYLPPNGFVDAVITSPLPPTQEYISILAERSKKWLPCPLVEMVSGDPVWLPEAFLK